MNLNHAVVDFTKISDVEIPDIFFNRLKTGVSEIDAIFGDGILPGMTATLIADPGVGKSILSLTIGELLTKANYRVGYATGEESQYQVAYNCKRLNVQELKVATITDVDLLAKKMEDLDFLVVDSFQCLTEKNDLNSRAKVKYFIDTLVKKAKSVNCAILFIVQINSDGSLKGGTTLPFAVDCNIRISKDKEDPDTRIISTYKNRFGPTMNHIAKMTETGYAFMGTMEIKEEPNKVKKTPIGEVRKAAILEMTDPPHITMDRVMNELDIQKQTAYNLLRELEEEGKIKKFGRGSTSIWKNSNVDEQTFLEDAIEILKQLI